MDRYFKVMMRNYPRYGQIGKLVPPINYFGCVNGWHTLVFPDGNSGLYAGEEIQEVKDREE